MIEFECPIMEIIFVVGPQKGTYVELGES